MADSTLSLWSEDSFLSIASRNSFLSIGSVGSALSIGSVGSAARRREGRLLTAVLLGATAVALALGARDSD